MIKSRRTKPRPGRLKGKALADLRIQCFQRDNWQCKKCSKGVALVSHEWSWSAHMSHIHAKRVGGDSLENVETLCGDCHRAFHACGPSMTKPVPAKQSVYESPDAGPEPWAVGGNQ